VTSLKWLRDALVPDPAVVVNISDPEPSPNEEKLELKVEKLSRELEKPTVEIPKLRRESGWRATGIPPVVSIAAVCVTVVVSLASVFNTQRGQTGDQEKADRERALRCVTTASVVANVSLYRSEKSDALPSGGKIDFANVVFAAYPPSVADWFLRSLAPRLAPSDAASRATVANAVGDRQRGQPRRRLSRREVGVLSAIAECSGLRSATTTVNRRRQRSNFWLMSRMQPINRTAAWSSLVAHSRTCRGAGSRYGYRSYPLSPGPGSFCYQERDPKNPAAQRYWCCTSPAQRSVKSLWA
jgi:hypothetical protein